MSRGLPAGKPPGSESSTLPHTGELWREVPSYVLACVACSLPGSGSEPPWIHVWPCSSISLQRSPEAKAPGLTFRSCRYYQSSLEGCPTNEARSSKDKLGKDYSHFRRINLTRTRVKAEDGAPSEVSQTQKDTYRLIPFIRGPSSRQIQRDRKQNGGWQGRGEGKEGSVLDGRGNSAVEMDTARRRSHKGVNLRHALCCAPTEVSFRLYYVYFITIKEKD